MVDRLLGLVENRKEGKKTRSLWKNQFARVPLSVVLFSDFVVFYVTLV